MGGMQNGHFEVFWAMGKSCQQTVCGIIGFVPSSTLSPADAFGGALAMALDASIDRTTTGDTVRITV